MTLVGTCGYSYPDWKGSFYPTDIKDGEMLAFYASRFPAVEIDFTYYRMPTQRTMEQIERKTPAGFEFAVKAYRGMTHERPASRAEMRTVFEAFRTAVEPMVSKGKLGAVLTQFPFGFRPGRASLDYLTEVRELLSDVPVVVEFRNREWVNQATFDFLRQMGMGYCAVDEPALKGLMPPVTAATSDVGYVRFHGRNGAKWWKHEEAWERYNYLYIREELAEWVPRITELAVGGRKTFVLFNNCHAGQAAANARDMQALLALDEGGHGYA
jgi:uncharacterized protein YecE (DUF72 family)